MISYSIREREKALAEFRRHLKKYSHRIAYWIIIRKYSCSWKYREYAKFWTKGIRVQQPRRKPPLAPVLRVIQGGKAA